MAIKAKKNFIRPLVLIIVVLFSAVLWTVCSSTSAFAHFYGRDNWFTYNVCDAVERNDIRLIEQGINDPFDSSHDDYDLRAKDNVMFVCPKGSTEPLDGWPKVTIEIDDNNYRVDHFAALQSENQTLKLHEIPNVERLPLEMEKSWWNHDGSENPDLRVYNGYYAVFSNRVLAKMSDGDDDTDFLGKLSSKSEYFCMYQSSIVDPTPSDMFTYDYFYDEPWARDRWSEEIYEYLAYDYSISTTPIDLSDGSCSLVLTNNSPYNDIKDDQVTFKATPRKGVEFVKWIYEPTYPSASGPEFRGELDPGSFITMDTGQLMTVTAVFSGSPIATVTYDRNGGTTFPEPRTKEVTYGENYVFPETNPTRDGYDFDGWWTESDEGELVTTDTKCENPDDHTLYAHWKFKECTVTFDGRGIATPDPSGKTVTYTEPYGDLPEPTSDGYNFEGWYLDSSYTKGPITKDSIVIDWNDHTLYAKWSLKTFTVTFNNNGHGTPNPVSKTVIYNNTYGDLASISCDGYIFGGWYFDQECTDGPVQATSIVKKAANHYLYAKWNSKEITVSFASDGDISPNPTKKTVYFNQPYGQLATAGKTGYSLAGWYLNPECTGPEITKDTIVSISSDHKLYPKWTANTYKVTLDPQGHGGMGKRDITVTYAQPYGDIPTLSEYGYYYDGWYMDKDGTGERIYDFTRVRTAGDHTLYAKWTAASTTVTFDSNGGSEVSPNRISETFDQKYQLPATPPTKTGYDFSGWWTTKDGGQEITSESILKTVDPHTLFAHWTAKQFIVTFDENSGDTEAQPNSILQTYDSTYVLPDVEPTKYGYSFAGWWIESNGAGQITDKTIVDILRPTTVYAHWTPNSYMVKFDNNGADTAAKPEQVETTFDGPYTLPDQNPIKEGYVFAGWWTDPVDGNQIKSDTICKLAEPQTLYAHWAATTNTVSFNKNTGDTNPDPKEIDQVYDTPFKLPTTNPTKKGYEFDGWSTEAVGGQKITSETIYKYNEPITLYAQWKVNQYIVTYDENGGDTQANPRQITIEYDSVYKIPDVLPTRIGYDFVGWFTEAEQGDQVTAETICKTAENHTLYAHWDAQILPLDIDLETFFAPQTIDDIAMLSAMGALGFVAVLFIFINLKLRRKNKKK